MCVSFKIIASDSARHFWFVAVTIISPLKRKCQPTDVVTAFIAVIILWPFLSEIAKICVFSHGKCVKCLFAEASELECFC